MELTSSPTTATIPILFAMRISRFSRAKRCIQIGNSHSEVGYAVHFMVGLGSLPEFNHKAGRISLFTVAVQDLNTPFYSRESADQIVIFRFITLTIISVMFSLIADGVFFLAANRVDNRFVTGMVGTYEQRIGYAFYLHL